MPPTISHISIGTLFAYFLFYFLVHLMLAYGYRMYSESAKTIKTDESIRDMFRLGVRWWPMVYLLFILTIFYLG